MKKAIPLALFILASQAAGLIGSLYTAPAIPGWYAGLIKPAFNPPSWLFGPVWITLYTFMGIAAYLIWRKRGEQPGADTALYFFGVHLVANALWSYFFFGLQNPGLALACIAVLWLMIVAMIFWFIPFDRRAAYLLAPYLAWVSFASLLNFAIWRLNS